MKPSKPGREANPSTSAGRLLFPNFDLNGWSPARPRPRTPLYLAGDDPMGEPFVYKELGDRKVPYFQLRQNFSTEKQNLPQFVKDIERKWKGRQFPFLVIDLRLNQGGNMLLTQKFFQSLDQYLTKNGKIYVPLGARTFSAGVLGAALIKHGNKKQVVFIGEDVGGREQFWSEVTRVRFPNSEMRATYSSALHDIKDGCNKRPECYWWYFENANPAIGELRPEIYVPTTFADYYSGKDPILNKIAELENIDLKN